MWSRETTEKGKAKKKEKKRKERIKQRKKKKKGSGWESSLINWSRLDDHIIV